MVVKSTAPSVHKEPPQEHEQIAIALNPRRMEPLLTQVFRLEQTEAQVDKPGARVGRYDCRILDAKYEPGDYCTILYELEDDIITGTFKWDSDEDEMPEAITVIPSLGMRVYRFPNDPALPSLTKALDSKKVSAALSAALPVFRADAARILRCEVKTLRFRPGRRCTVRLDAWLRDIESGAISHQVLYGKIYHDLEKAERVYQQMLSLSSSVPAQQGHVTFATASAFLPELAMVLQDPIQGVPLDSFISCETEVCDPRGLAGIVSAGAALAAFHTSGLTAGKPRSIHSELARFKKRGARIGQVNPEVGNHMIQLSEALSAWLDTLDPWGATTCLVHGDCKPAQFLIQDGRVALLDFDHCGMADPAVDVGTFLATLQQRTVEQTLKDRGRLAPGTAWMPELKQRFLEAYCSASGSPSGFLHRAAWYEAVGLLRKAIRGFERSPYSPLPEALMAEAWKGLKRLPPPS